MLPFIEVARIVQISFLNDGAALTHRPRKFRSCFTFFVVVLPRRWDFSSDCWTCFLFFLLKISFWVGFLQRETPERKQGFSRGSGRVRLTRPDPQY